MKFAEYIERHGKAFKLFLALSLTILFWTVLLACFSPEEIVAWLGVKNGYAVMFLVSLFGGVSALTAGSYFGVLLTLAAGGLDPILLGIVSGTAATVGDTVFYFAGKHGGRTLSRGKLRRTLKRMSRWLNKKPKWFAPILLYFLAAFTPIPNDITAGVMGLARRSWLATVLPLVLGNITLTIIVAYLGYTFW